MTSYFILLLLLLLVVIPISAWEYAERQEIEEATQGGFAVSAWQGNTLLVGHPKENAAYVYTLTRDGTDISLSSSWTKSAFLQISSGSNSASFGGSVALSCIDEENVHPCYHVVADQNYNNGKGAVYVYQFWSSYVTIEPDSSESLVNFGCALAVQHLSSTTVELFIGSHSSVVYRYLRTGDTPMWERQSTLTPVDSGSGGSLFGTSLALYNNRLVIGAPGGAGSSGYAYYYSREGQEDAFSFQVRLAPPSHEQQVGLRFGSSVDLSGEDDGRLIVGVCRSTGSSDGQAYIFYEGTFYTLTGQLSLEGKLVPPSATVDTDERHNFGCSVGMSKASGSRVVAIGAPSNVASSIGGRSGSVYTFSLPIEVFGWGMRQRLAHADSRSGSSGGVSVGNCGVSLSMTATGQEIVIGCPTHNTLDASVSTALQAEVLSYVDTTVSPTDSATLIRCTVSLFAIFSALMSAMLLSLCGAVYVREQRDRLSSYIRLTAHREKEPEAEGEGIALLDSSTGSNVSRLTDSAHSHSGDRAPHRRVNGGSSSGGGARTDGRSEATEAYHGRVLDFRFRDYTSDFLLSAVSGVCGYLQLYVLYANQAFVAFSLLVLLNLAMVVTPVLLLFLSLYHRRRLPLWLSLHLRLSLHLQVHHSGADGLGEWGGEFAPMAALTVAASLALSAPELLKFLPWRLTNFCMASKGYPSYAAFKWLHGCSMIISVSYLLVQVLLFLPLGELAVYNASGGRVTQSLASPTTPQLATYLHSSLGDEVTPDMFSTAGVFGVVLLGVLGSKLGRAIVKHRKLFTQGRGLCRACALICLECLQRFRQNGLRGEATGAVRHSSQVGEGGEMVAVGRSRETRRYTYSQDDDDDFIDDSIEHGERDYVHNQLRNITFKFSREDGEEDEGSEEEYRDDGETNVRVPARREIRVDVESVTPSMRRTIEIEVRRKKAKGKLLVLPV